MTEAAIDRLRFDEYGLIPAVIQDDRSGEVLMVAYMNRDSLKKTLKKGETYFWSRSRREMWHKGETSGNRQTVKRVTHDCDGDALLIRVEQKGVACHTGEYSCFFSEISGADGSGKSLFEILGALARVIGQRNKERPQESYTTKLFEGGTDRILKKIGEEAGEVIIAAKNHNKKEISWEVADFLYHTLVLLEAEGVGLSDVAGELANRFGKRMSDR